MAGPWALEIITDGHLRPIGNVWEIQEILQLANRYSRGDQSVGLKVDPDWGKAVAMVEFFREIRGMPIEEHAFGRPANYGFLNVF